MLRNAYKRICRESAEGKNRWNQAIADLRKEDHYLLVMVDQSLEPASDFWTVAKWSGAITICLVVAFGLWEYLDEKHLIPRWITNVPFVVWLIGAIVIWGGVSLGLRGMLGEIFKILWEAHSTSFPSACFGSAPAVSEEVRTREVDTFANCDGRAANYPT